MNFSEFSEIAFRKNSARISPSSAVVHVHFPSSYLNEGFP